MKQNSRSRKWQITINNPHDSKMTHEEIVNIIEETNGIIYYCLSDEIGESGTYHTHIYIVSNNAIRFSTLKNKFPKAHFEIARGSNIENRDYVFKLGEWKDHKKAETNLKETHLEWGEMPIERQGARNDLADLFDMVEQDMDNYSILEENPQYMFRISDIDRTRQVIKEKKFRNIFRELTVTYLSGETESGKTRYVMEKYGYENVYRVTDYKHPFDGYQGQSVICFDEFRSSLPIANMLNYLDGYPVELECRYSNKIACYTIVYIISNISLEQQFIYEQENEYETWKAFLRRIHNNIVYTKNHHEGGLLK